MRRLKWGFTLVELIVVIATIGILATISIIGLSRYQADTRDARRAASVSVISEALEKYYDANGEYPSCTSIKAPAATVTTTTLAGVDNTALVAPQAATTVDNSIECTSDGNTLSANGTDFFEYTGDNSVACNGTVSCLQYSLKYKEESTGAIKTVISRRNTSIATSGAATISATTTSFTSVNLSWTTVQNASSYVLQISTTASFPNDSSTQTINGVPSTTYNATGLSAGISYFFRVRSDALSSTGNWSNTLPVTTLVLAAPGSCSATSNSSSQLTAGCNTVANASTYDVDYSTSSTFASSVVSNTGLGSPSYVATGLSTGTTYYFRFRAVAPTYTGPWSSTFNATTTVPVPTGLALVVNSSSQITASWTAVSVATSYSIDYSINSNFASSTTITGIAGTSRAVTGLQQGRTWYFRVYAVVGSVSSAPSAGVAATTTLDTPSSLSFGAARPAGVYSTGNSNWLPGQSFSQGSGNYYYAYGSVGGACPSGASMAVWMQGRYNSPANWYAAGWTYQPTWVLISPTSGYQAIFEAYARCDGPNASSGQVYLGTRCITSGNVGC
ncbi:MAG: hypothetical protein JWM52_660 [Candidatus Saccharibacteria bacterium]|nr:hypothetical protein [Candidatus Saccharibacteria bacterium]